MMTLYHGSYLEVNQPLAKAGRRNLDFGQGFYLTILKDQAEAWARVISSRRGRYVTPIVSTFHFDAERAKTDGMIWKVFASYDLDWLEYVVACRNGKDASSDYDIVEGGVANDNVIDTVEDYEKGIITAEQALGQLQYKEVNHQICLLNQLAIDRYLQFTGSYTLKIEDET